jgi:hypothetical protein
MKGMLLESEERKKTKTESAVENRPVSRTALGREREGAAACGVRASKSQCVIDVPSYLQAG